jgi:adenylate cyclase
MTRRELRLGSGLILFVYITVHLTDHALGLVSVDVAERALHLSVRVWHSLAGTTVLYGAAAVHIALALVALYERRTLRMPLLQAIRIALGFGMPLLVIGHVAATRMASDLYGLSPTYTRIVWGLWASDSEGRQLALLAPGWVHGCLGLQFAFGHRPLWQRMRPILFGASLLLPVLAGLGFLAMARELAAIAPHALPPSDTMTVAQAVAIGRLRDGLLSGYFVLIGAAFAARALRARLERRRNRIVEIDYPARTVDVPRGWTVLEASRAFGIPHLSLCGGNARCSTCRIRVVRGTEHCPPPNTRERDTLERIHAPADVRLACQLRPIDHIAVVPMLDATSAAAAGREVLAPILDRDVAVLLIKLTGWKAMRHAPRSSHDVIHALNHVAAVVGGEIKTAGGLCGPFDSDGAMVIFGIAGDRDTACRQAMAAASAIEQGIERLNPRLAQDVGFVAECVLAIHTGPAAIAYVGYGSDRLQTAVGDTVLAARAMRDHAAAHRMRFVVSRDAALAAGLANIDDTWMTIDGPRTGLALRFRELRGLAQPLAEPS